ncbi:hypothetical protein [Enterobacter hormaechei]|uniref:hypothetical protein n=1 Tax=Enterobacter hormaechei TaxID=158836 RepID=UPI0013D3D5B0|nr:hypothetical protein [Enterobacter hormaechei]
MGLFPVAPSVPWAVAMPSAGWATRACAALEAAALRRGAVTSAWPGTGPAA